MKIRLPLDIELLGISWIPFMFAITREFPHLVIVMPLAALIHSFHHCCKRKGSLSAFVTTASSNSYSGIEWC
jgi:hypothetical protein